MVCRAPKVGWLHIFGLWFLSPKLKSLIEEKLSATDAHSPWGHYLIWASLHIIPCTAALAPVTVISSWNPSFPVLEEEHSEIKTTASYHEDYWLDWGWTSAPTELKLTRAIPDTPIPAGINTSLCLLGGPGSDASCFCSSHQILVVPTFPTTQGWRNEPLSSLFDHQRCSMLDSHNRVLFALRRTHIIEQRSNYNDYQRENTSRWTPSASLQGSFCVLFCLSIYPCSILPCMSSEHEKLCTMKQI